MNTRQFKYQKNQRTDITKTESGIDITEVNNYTSITAMRQYEEFSMEELRFNDYNLDYKYTPTNYLEHYNKNKNLNTNSNIELKETATVAHTFESDLSTCLICLEPLIKVRNYYKTVIGLSLNTLI